MTNRGPESEAKPAANQKPTMEDLEGGAKKTTYPDGDTFTRYPDGKSIYSQPHGDTVTSYPNGTVETTNQKGDTTVRMPNGMNMSVPGDGSGWTITYPYGNNSDGIEQQYTPKGLISEDPPSVG